MKDTDNRKRNSPGISEVAKVCLSLIFFSFNQFNVAVEEVFGGALKQSLLQLQGRVLFLGMFFAVAEHIFCSHKPHVLCRPSMHLQPGNL